MSTEMHGNEPARRKGSVLGRTVRTLGTAFALGLWAAEMWHAWFSWDRANLDIDGVNYAVAANPEPWQLIGCAFSIAALAVLAYVWLRRETIGYRAASLALLAAAGPIGFVVPWTRDQANNPTADGMFLIGAFFTVLYGATALAVLLGVIEGFASSRRSRFGGLRPGGRRGSR
jgi:hypothetical protein